MFCYVFYPCLDYTSAAFGPLLVSKFPIVPLEAAHRIAFGVISCCFLVPMVVHFNHALEWTAYKNIGHKLATDLSCGHKPLVQICSWL